MVDEVSDGDEMGIERLRKITWKVMFSLGRMMLRSVTVMRPVNSCCGMQKRKKKKKVIDEDRMTMTIRFKRPYRTKGTYQELRITQIDIL